MKTPKSILATLIAIMVLLLFSECFKKGKDDPLISLRTRKARMTGAWKMTSGRSELTGGNYSTVYEYTKDRYVYTQTNNGQVSQTSGSGTEFTILISKNGSLEYTRALLPSQLPPAKNLGTWDFLSKMGSYKNKERIIFFLREFTTDYNIVFDIVELRNKKMVLRKVDQMGSSNYVEEFTFEQD